MTYTTRSTTYMQHTTGAASRVWRSYTTHRIGDGGSWLITSGLGELTAAKYIYMI
jgi:hypothetical protein